jgi:hypothetical protein
MDALNCFWRNRFSCKVLLSLNVDLESKQKPAPELMLPVTLQFNCIPAGAKAPVPDTRRVHPGRTPTEDGENSGFINA